MLWQILIPTVESRTKLLCELLDILSPQLDDDVEVLAYRDNREAGVGFKRNYLVSVADADYVSHVDDDDLVPDDFVSTIKPLLDGVDTVNFQIRANGSKYHDFIIYHGLGKTPMWFGDHRDCDIGHIMPMKRELHARGRFAEGWGDDQQWAAQVRMRRSIRTEHLIPRVMYEYRVSDGSLWNGEKPCAERTPDPEYPHVRYVRGD